MRDVTRGEAFGSETVELAGKLAGILFGVFLGLFGCRIISVMVATRGQLGTDRADMLVSRLSSKVVDACIVFLSIGCCAAIMFAFRR